MTSTPTATPTPTEFVRFREVNDHEGERWAFWLQATGNEDELAKLGALMAEQADPDQYRLYLDNREPEAVVDKLVEYADDAGEYNPPHQKVTGRLTCPDDLCGDAEALYKGGVMRFFAAEPADQTAPPTVIDPSRTGVVEGWDWSDYLRASLPDVLRADLVALLPGWEASPGTGLEVHVARALGVPCETVADTLAFAVLAPVHMTDDTSAIAAEADQ